MPRTAKPERVLVCGDRNWTDLIFLFARLDEVAADCKVVIHGCARGADSLAGLWAEKRGKTILPFPADWTTFGRAAGPIRNKRMLDEGKPDLVIAFHNDIERSKGTKNMLRIARAAGVPTMLFGETNAPNS